jgi:8-oxo-dGTP diphosphatase
MSYTTPWDATLPDVTEREAVRALFVEGSGAVLLMRAVEPQTQQAIWITPGGGRLAGEDPVAALHRELYEELGVTVPADPLPLPGLARRHSFTWGGNSIDQRESFFLIQCERFTPPLCVDGEPGATFECEHRWWAPEEIEQSPDHFAPEHLAATLRQILRSPTAPKASDLQ